MNANAVSISMTDLVLLMLGNKQIEKILCIACNKFIGEHSKRGLERCLFRLQGTLVQSGFKYKALNEDRVDEKKP